MWLFINLVSLLFYSLSKKANIFLKRKEKRRMLIWFFWMKATKSQHMEWNFIKCIFPFIYMLAEPLITSPYGLWATGIHLGSSLCKNHAWEIESHRYILPLFYSIIKGCMYNNHARGSIFIWCFPELSPDIASLAWQADWSEVSLLIEVLGCELQVLGKDLPLYALQT